MTSFCELVPLPECRSVATQTDFVDDDYGCDDFDDDDLDVCRDDLGLVVVCVSGENSDVRHPVTSDLWSVTRMTDLSPEDRRQKHDHGSSA